MEKEKLIGYLRTIVDVETKERIAEGTYNELVRIEKENAYAKYASVENISDKTGVTKKIKWLPFIGKMYLGILVAGVLGMIVQSILYTMSSGMGISADAIEIFSIMICLLPIWGWIIKKEISSAQTKTNEEQALKVQYVENVKKGRILLEKVQKDKADLTKVIDLCTQNLEKLYALNIVYPDYQYLEACGMFLQYLTSGRTHSLEQRNGDPGAYNLYENDLKFNIIKNQLDQVLKNQYILYEAVTEINGNIQSLCASIGKIELYAKQTAHNSKISAWCNAATAANVYAMRRMQEERFF